MAKFQVQPSKEEDLVIATMVNRQQTTGDTTPSVTRSSTLVTRSCSSTASETSESTHITAPSLSQNPPSLSDTGSQQISSRPLLFPSGERSNADYGDETNVPSYTDVSPLAKSDGLGSQLIEEVRSLLLEGLEARRKTAEEKNIPPIKFKDAVGRKFCFPYHLVKTWKVNSAPIQT